MSKTIFVDGDPSQGIVGTRVRESGARIGGSDRAYSNYNVGFRGGLLPCVAGVNPNAAITYKIMYQGS